MNKTEFLEMQNEMADYVYNYEYFIKCGVIFEAYYNSQFYKYMEEMHYYDIENGLLLTIHEMSLKGSSEEEINAFIDKVKTKFNNEKPLLENKHKKCLEVKTRTDSLSKEQLEEIEKIYLDFVKKNHPIVKLKTTNEEKEIFPVIRMLYYENNINGLKQILEDHKDLFKDVEIPEEEYNRVNGYYYNTRIQINKDRDEKSKKYPYDKSHATEDEISIAREEGDLRTKISKLKEMNQNLRKDCKANFNREITLD